jgi:hypothetical protein
MPASLPALSKRMPMQLRALSEQAAPARLAVIMHARESATQQMPLFTLELHAQSRLCLHHNH